MPSFLPPNGDLFANLFATSGNSAGKIGAQIHTQVIPGPPILRSITINTLGEREISSGPVTASAIGTGIDTLVWSNLQPVVGPDLGVPAIVATLSPTGAFSWDPTGSKTGSKGSGRVEYRWTATVTDYLGSTTGAAFSVILIPEPATSLLAALASLTFVTRVRRPT